MKILTATICAVTCFVSTLPTQAATKIGSEPTPGIERTVTVGSPVLERYRYDLMKVAVPQTEMIRGTITGDIRIPAGERLHQVESRAKYKACSVAGPCGLDDDGDGVFDRIALDDTVAALKLRAPVQYDLLEVAAPSAQGNFRQTVIYLGATGDTLRLSYREFLNDMARAAFTEELTFPLSKSFPQAIAFKDVRLTIFGVDGLGLRYRLEPQQ